MSILLLTVLTKLLYLQTFSISSSTNVAAFRLTLFIVSFSDIFTSLALSFIFLAKMMSSHAALDTGFNGVIDLIVIAKTSGTASR
jgi:hypothetical protein